MDFAIFPNFGAFKKSINFQVILNCFENPIWMVDTNFEEFRCYFITNNYSDESIYNFLKYCYIKGHAHKKKFICAKH
jgi:hypothetical protein